MNEIDKLAWLCLKDKKLLVARSKGKATYYIPGGKRDPGETDQQALIREIKEEVSVDLLPETIKYAETFRAEAHGKAEGVQVKVACYFAEYAGELRADAEIEEITWFAYADKAKCSAVTIIIMDWLKSNELL